MREYNGSKQAFDTGSKLIPNAGGRAQEIQIKNTQDSLEVIYFNSSGHMSIHFSNFNKVVKISKQVVYQMN